jgi:ABC-type transport system involved in cytochrome c biogenesis permease component
MFRVFKEGGVLFLSSDEILVHLLPTSKACLEFSKSVGVSEMNVEDMALGICFIGSLFVSMLCCSISFAECFALPLSAFIQ